MFKTISMLLDQSFDSDLGTYRDGLKSRYNATIALKDLLSNYPLNGSLNLALAKELSLPEYRQSLQMFQCIGENIKNGNSWPNEDKQKYAQFILNYLMEKHLL